MKQFILTLALAGICLSSGIFGALLVSNHQAPVAGGIEPPFTAFKTAQAVNVTTTSTQVIATTTGRLSLMLQNTSSFQTIYCSAGSNGIDQTGFFLTASSTLRFPNGGEPTFAGAINCIASTTVKVLVLER